MAAATMRACRSRTPELSFSHLLLLNPFLWLSELELTGLASELIPYSTGTSLTLTDAQYASGLAAPWPQSACLFFLGTLQKLWVSSTKGGIAHSFANMRLARIIYCEAID